MAASPEFIQEFLAETREGLERLDRELVALEADPKAIGHCDQAFRILHTIKGNSGFLDYPRVGEIAHAGEAVLQRLRSSEITLDPTIADVLFRLLDALRELMQRIETTGSEGDDSFAAVRFELKRIAGLTKTAPKSPTVTIVASAAATESPLPSPTSQPSRLTTIQVGPGDAISESALHAHGDLSGDSRAPGMSMSRFRETLDHVPIPAFASAPVPPGSPDNVESVGVAHENPKVNLPLPNAEIIDTGSSIVSPAAVLSSDSSSTIPPRSRAESGSGSGAASMVRVDVNLLDRLMNLVGELVLARNQIVEMQSRQSNPAMLNPVQRLNVLTTELQEGVLKTRMHPIGNIWNRYPRLVRDLARQCGKDVKLEMIGADTELDKALVEAISDPLIHLLRNSIDHGIERPHLRAIKRKPKQGRITLRAFHESGQVRIEITDDGAGLDIDKIRQKAVQRGFVNQDESLNMSEKDLQNSIFMPGFSTAEEISNVSGRGVGMDVVKTNIEAVGGTIEIETQKDVGTTFRLTVPLTLAIIPALIVACDGQRFAIPQTNVMEMLSMRKSSGLRIEQFHNSPVLRLRGEVLPVVYLAEQLKMSSSKPPLDAPSSVNLMILKTGTRQFALIVDRIGNSEEIVVKPFGFILDGMSEYSGATIMGDGSLALILDVRGIAQRAGLFASDRPMAQSATAYEPNESEMSVEEAILVAEVGERHRVAFWLRGVIRIEHVSRSLIEHSDGQAVLQYRGEILPLVFVDRVLALTDVAQSRDLLPSTITSAEGDETLNQELSLVVYGAPGRTVGLVVREVVDIADQTTQPQLSAHISPVVGTTVVLGQITDLIDVTRLIESAGVRFLEPVEAI
ncbi:MAG: chemotaxis protein CheA [Planctomycetia bacterium]|nr:chemotaxis protein CheA [Planctomycetia bacterium]